MRKNVKRSIETRCGEKTGNRRREKIIKMKKRHRDMREKMWTEDWEKM